VSEFEYLIGLLTIVLGLAVAKAMGGIGSFLIAERRTLRNWIDVGFCLALVIFQIGWWKVLWSIFNNAELLSNGLVYSWIAATALLYLASYVLVPQSGHFAGSVRTTSKAIPPAFFYCVALHFCAVPFYFIIQREISFTIAWPLLMVALCVLGAFLKSDRAMLTLVAIWLVMGLSVVLIDPGAAFVNAEAALLVEP
jgi:hypothetical protein